MCVAQRLASTTSHAQQNASDGIRKLTLATDFSGMDMAAHALKQANVDVRHMFASEQCPHIRAHIRRNHMVEALYECATEKPAKHYRGTDEIDVYVAGPPCQPWSNNNKGAKGEDDPRGRLFASSIDFILQAQPRAFVLENVCGLTWQGGGKYLT